MSLYSIYFGTLSVKDPTFGAKGDGVTDDTAAIQACLNAAFNQPIGNGSSTTLNKAVFFPSGQYLVSSPHTTSVTGAAIGVGGAVKLAVTSSTNFPTGSRVQVSGIVGTTEANNIWYVTNNDSTHITLIGSTFSNAWVSGGTVNAPALTITNTQGAHIFGTGKNAAQIDCTTANAPCISLNGFGYSQIDNLNFIASTGGICCDYSWDGIQISSQEVTFLSCFFSGGAYGLMIGVTGSQSSETLIAHCSFGPCTSDGIKVGNFNALAANVIGGNFQNCGIGIHVSSGSAPVICGTAFQSSTDTDIAVDNVANDCYAISGCRSESVNFGRFHAGPGVALSGCVQTNSTAGIFVQTEGGAPGAFTLDGCRSKNGTITGSGVLYIRGNSSPAQAVTGAANNGSGLIRLAVTTTTGMSTGMQKTVSGVGGTTEANATWIITVIDGTHIDLQGSAFVHAWTSGGVVDGQGSAFGNPAYITSFTGTVAQNI